MSTQSTQESADQTEELHGGRLIARRLKAHGVSKLFTLSGGHLFSIYDGCREEGIEIVDVRHEQTAAFAAEGWAKVTREPGVCALTAGPGVTNGMSAIASAQANHTPMLVLGGRAPTLRWGQGSLQEIDHVPFVRPLCKLATTAQSTAEIPGLVDEALATAVAPHSGPAFLDFPLDYVFMSAPEPDPQPQRAQSAKGPDAGDLQRAATLLREAERPVVMAGTDLYWGRGEQALLELAETLRIPVFLNGLARGCVPADHELFFSRTRSQALKDADVALVIGVPMDFRLGFGGAFGATPRSSRSTWPSHSARIRASPRSSCMESSPPRSASCAPRLVARRLRAPRGLRTCGARRRRGGRPSASSSPTHARRFIRCGCTRSLRECSTATRS